MEGLPVWAAPVCLLKKKLPGQEPGSSSKKIQKKYLNWVYLAHTICTTGAGQLMRTMRAAHSCTMGK